MKLLKGITRAAAALCLLFITGQDARAQASDPALLINRLTLISAAPGGPADNPPCYPPEALPPAGFEVLINNELGSSPADSYYRDRARLLAASYSVLVYSAADYRPVYSGKQSRPLAVIGADSSGSFRLDQAGLSPGGNYVWLVTATVESGRGAVTLWSSPLWFRLAPDEQRVPALLSGTQQSILRLLISMTAQQERAREGARTALRGLALYYNYAAASDTYFCAPLDERGPSPWPEAQAGGWPLPALLQLGDCAAEAVALLAQQERSAPPDLPRARRLGGSIVQVAYGLAGAAGSQGDAELERLAQTGRRLEATDAAALPGLLSELLIALDGAAGTGSRPQPAMGLASFPDYARASLRRLEAVEEHGPLLQATMRPDDWTAWSETLRQLRAELTLLADDVERGRVNMAQLEQQLARARQIVPPVYPEEWRYVDRETGAVLPDAARIRPDEGEPVRRLARELYWFQLSRLLRLMLPPPENNPR